MPLLKMKHVVKTKQSFIDNTDCPDIPFTKIPYDSTFTNYGITFDLISQIQQADSISTNYGISFDLISQAQQTDSISTNYGTTFDLLSQVNNKDLITTNYGIDLEE